MLQACELRLHSHFHVVLAVFTPKAHLFQWHMMHRWAREVFITTELIACMSELCEVHVSEGLSSVCMLIAIDYVYP